MAITRRTARFIELATEVEAVLAEQGLRADGAVIDRLLNERAEYVASLLGVPPHTALRSAPEHLPQLIAAEIISNGLARAMHADVIDLTERRRRRQQTDRYYRPPPAPA
ncbi:hypothetical protein AB6N24_17890 [Cellulomonas sp. 179-A 4D5 NHS]|uniref:hypothetical protein n=1 Tax=Cellulomonas sp. 179-A 4D5 NHS TaxID=3142378 RepID=UPI00399FA066